MMVGQFEVLEFVKKQGGCGFSEVKDFFGMSKANAHRFLNKLIVYGFLVFCDNEVDGKIVRMFYPKEDRKKVV